MGEQRISWFPSTGFGWLALVASAVGLGSWIVLPVLTSLFGEKYPITDSYAMPLIGLVLTAIGAVLSTIAVWRGQRSVTNLIAMGLTVVATLFLGLFVIGEGLSGV